MPYVEEDTRKVQTAVIGRAESDWPVFLPYDHDEFDRFMLGRTREDFYCGTLLGGCGKKLSAKRYTDKKCHFAHRPPVHCRRTETGEDSADHLYIGQALQRWLRRQRHDNVKVAYLEPGSAHGGAVEVRFGPDPRLIRVQLNRLNDREWQATRAQFAEAHTHVHWAYGPHSGLGHHEVQAAGHAIRFTCHTEDGSRVVRVGTQDKDHTIQWTTLNECRLTDEGIITPHLTDDAVRRDAVSSVAFPLAPGTIAFTAATEVTRQNDLTRRRYEADIQPIGSVVVSARISLPQSCEPPLPYRLHVIEGTPLLLPLADSSPSEPTWLIHAEGFSSLPNPADPRWPDLRPAPRPDTGKPQEAKAFTVGIPKVGGGYGFLTPHEYRQLSRTQRRRYWQKVRRRSEAESGAHVPSSTSSASTVHGGSWAKLGGTRAAVVRSVREALISAAHRQVCVGWHTLAKAAGLKPNDLSDKARAMILVAIDRPSGPDGVLLSALVISSEHTPVPYFDDLLRHLGRPHGLRPIELGQVRKAEQARTFAAYRDRGNRTADPMQAETRAQSADGSRSE
ncbi:competence protein CoiA family protein [Streptomyces sp. NBC_01314]|uniref:competence protein CoiA family protein n=1 Tax=Streptomyces sp. NBC_01314 TaxID=2903821 RepID=UPI003086C0F2|nr:competence protein CoiA family protein [Streptomyces sp. NBC_01314]